MARVRLGPSGPFVDVEGGAGGGAIDWLGTTGAIDNTNTPVLLRTNGGPGGVFRPSRLVFPGCAAGDVLTLQGFTYWILDPEVGQFRIRVVASNDDLSTWEVVPNTELNFTTIGSGAEFLYLNHVAWFQVPSAGEWQLALETTVDPAGGGGSAYFNAPEALQVLGSNLGQVTWSPIPP